MPDQSYDEARWREAITARPAGAYPQGLDTILSQESPYAVAVRKVLGEIEHAYITASEPMPHPVWWKRLLRRPYRKVDVEQYLDELRKIHHA